MAVQDPVSSEPIIEFVEIYDPATGTWTPTGDLARPDAQYRTATRLLDGTVLLAGGAGGPDEAAESEERSVSDRKGVAQIDNTGSLGYKVRVLSPFPTMEIYADY